MFQMQNQCGRCFPHLSGQLMETKRCLAAVNARFYVSELIFQRSGFTVVCFLYPQKTDGNE